MSILRRWGGNLFVLACIGGVAATTYAWWGERQERTEAIQRANAIADTFAAVVDSLNGRIEERGRTAERATELAEYLEGVLGEEVAALLSEIRQANATIRSHTRTIARLTATLDTLAPVETLPDSSKLVRIDWEERFDPDNFYTVRGDVRLPPLGDAEVNLGLDVGFSLDVIVSRTADNALRCDGDTHLPGAVLTALECSESLEDPLTPRRTLFDELGFGSGLGTATNGALLLLGYILGRS